MTFGSVYEITNPLSTVAEQRFVEWFSGTGVDSKRWSLEERTGNTTGSGMHDGLNGGYLLVGSVAGTTQQALLTFDDTKQYHGSGTDGSTIIWVCRLVSPMPNSANVATQGAWGMMGTHPSYWLNGIKINVPTGDASYIGFYTMNHATEAGTNTDMPVGLAMSSRTYQLEQNNANANCYIDGQIKATRTSGMSIYDMQPFLNQKYPDSDVHATYCEAWNH